MEVFTQVTIADELAYLPAPRTNELVALIEEEAKIINGPAHSLRAKEPREW